MSQTTLTCPVNLSLTCRAQTVDLDAYGTAQVMINGATYPAGLASVAKNLNNCNVGTIVRSWSVVGENQNLIECSQTLTFEAGDFDESNITWPESEVKLIGCGNTANIDSLPPGVAGPTFDYVLCSQIGTSHTDSRFDFGPDCDKIVREWTVINWCVFRPGFPGGIWKFNQVFKISNGNPPTIACPIDLTVNADKCNGAQVNLPPAVVTGMPCNGDYLITNNSIHADTTNFDASGFYPLGSTVITYETEFGCGERLYCQTTVTVPNEIKPVPYCLATLNVALMPIDSDGDGLTDEGMVDIWAKDVNVNSFHPCNADTLTFTFDELGEQMSRTFTCDEVGNNAIRVFVSDAQGRQSFCVVNINIQNNAAQIPDCAPAPGQDGMLVSGLVSDPSGLYISGVDIRYRDTETQQAVEDLGQSLYTQVPRGQSNLSGEYIINGVSIDRAYLVSAYKPGDVTKVTQDDIDILETYIKGEATFSNPYTYLAADINEDGLVDIDDFHLLKNLIGHSETAWPNQKQWLFFHLTDGLTINTIPSINDFEQSKLSQGVHTEMKFLGILKGDLDYYESL